MKNNSLNPNKHLWLSFLFFWILTLGACSSKENEAETSVGITDTSTESASAAEENSAATTVLDVNPAAKIIRNATVKMQVTDFRKSLAAIENTVKAQQAYIASSNETHTDEKLENTLIIRVPSGNLDQLLNKLVAHGIYLDYKNIASEDVSTEFVDISARIKSKKAVEERYLAFLKETKSIKDMLELENEIRKIREEIEATQARINYINSQTAYSTITLEVYQLTTGIAPHQNSYWVRIVNALGTGWEMLLSFIIGLLYIWPLLLVIPAFVYLSRRFLQKYPPVR